MTKRYSDLIAIANSELAEKLQREKERDNDSDAEINAAAQPANHLFQNDVRRALLALNLFRYGLGLTFLVLISAVATDGDWNLLPILIQPKLFFFTSLVLLASAIVFTYLNRKKDSDISSLITFQLTLDVVLAGLITHSTGGLTSNFILLYLVVVATGSVVLPKKPALALASGAVILFFSEHVSSIYVDFDNAEANYYLLVTYSLTLMAVSLLVSHLAERIRSAEQPRYTPGAEKIDEFLQREEISALKAALEATDHNKTEAAKLLGLSFRSFRYKLNKFDIG